MAITFLEFCAAILAFIVVTQIILPLFAPKHFNFFWLFRKGTASEDNIPTKENAGDSLRKAVKEALWMKEKAEETVEKTRKKTAKNLDNAQDLHDKLG